MGKAKTKAVEAEVDDVETAEVAAIEGVTASFDPDPFFARGDCRDAMLEVIRSAVDWSKFGEDRQRDINTAIDNASREIIQKLTRGLAAEGRQSVNATVDQIVLKDGGLKINLKASYDPDSLALLAKASVVEIAIADATAHMEQRGEARVDPDQPDLIPQGADDDSDLVDAADPPAELLTTFSKIVDPDKGECEIEVSLATGMIVATPTEGNAATDRFDLREATPDELAAERNRLSDDFDDAEPTKETVAA